VVDLRARRAFAAGHVPGTLGFDLDGSFATYLGWLIPWGTPLTLLGHTPGQVAEAQRELVRIGIDRPAAAATGDPGDWAGGRTGYRASIAASFLDAAGRTVVAVDDEYERAARVGLPLDGLLARGRDVSRARHLP
jgi:hydroxyacylglutathione hydrolase